MDGSRLDKLARGLASRADRRGAAKGMGGLLAGGVLAALGVGPTRSYSDNCERFTLSAGKNPKKEIDVDDDMSVFLNNDRIFHDNDGVIGIGLEPIEPISFRAEVGDRLRIVAKDGQRPCRSLSPLWLHCRDGGSPKRLTRGVEVDCEDGRPPRTFFDKTFRI